MGLPAGTVTLVFTDVEGSTRLLQELGADAFVRALEDHRRLLREAVAAHGGVEVEMQGDSFHFAFADAVEAVAAAHEAQQTLATHSWEAAPIRVRMGVHSGEPLISGDLYAGLDVHRAARVMSAGHGGQVLISETTRALLGGEFDLRDLGEHRLKDLLAPIRLYQLGKEDFPAPKSLYRTNLPVPATPFLGRRRELSELAALLADGTTRLVTLTGPGGTGKTRLAVQSAAEAADLYPDGIFWAALASLRDPRLVIATIGQALDAKGDLAEHIGSRRMLVVLDNFEQLADAAADVAALVTSCPALTLLATSREPLHLTAEREYPVSPLDEADAVALFHERARAAGTETAGNGEIPLICLRLDRLPLAIELAAARVRALSPRTLLERLEHRLPLLTGGARDLPERQRTLRATIAWSYELLTPEEQRMFARLAVFAGGCTLDAAEEVCDADLDTLQSLVDKNLVRQSGGRYWMLETIGEFARERHDTSNEAAKLRQKHAEFFIELAERAYPNLRGSDQARWLELLEHEHDNLRAVLSRSINNRDDTAVRLAGTLARFWLIRGYLDEGRQWLEAALREVPSAATRPRAFRGLAILSMEQGELDRAAETAEEALTLDRAAGDEAGAAQSMGLLADVVAFRGDLATAKSLYEETALLARRRGERLELAITLYNLGHVARLQDDSGGAEEYFEEALGIFREQGDAMGQAGVLQSLVAVTSERGDHDRAFALLEEAAALFMGIRYVSGLLDVVDAFAGLLGPDRPSGCGRSSVGRTRPPGRRDRTRSRAPPRGRCSRRRYGVGADRTRRRRFPASLGAGCCTDARGSAGVRAGAVRSHRPIVERPSRLGAGLPRGCDRGAGQNGRAAGCRSGRTGRREPLDRERGTSRAMPSGLRRTAPRPQSS